MISLVKFLRVLLFAGLLAGGAVRAVEESRVIVPGATQRKEAHAEPGSGYGAISVLGVLILAGAGAWLLLRGRKLNLGNRDSRLLTVSETRSLGNRQYLVVATYEDKKFLLGVCPGRIDLLSPLTAPEAVEKTR